MPQALYVATTNPGKLRDFAAAAGAFDVEVLPLPNLKDISPPVEDGLTFEDNARLKAVYYSAFAPDRVIIADDSGLEVDALGGEPGVRSARFADDAGFTAPGIPLTATDERNNLYLLQRLASHIVGKKTARYRCVIAAARGGKIIASAEGSVEGQVLAKPRGTGGFGYDPLFYLAESGKTMAEMDLVKKQALSHRGKALRALLDELRRGHL